MIITYAVKFELLFIVTNVLDIKTFCLNRKIVYFKSTFVRSLGSRYDVTHKLS